ncbi:ATP-binding protein [Streptomyces diastatochromogenes]|nr:ATP-binding protein [Streptomyces diastatochromogenes]
MTSAALRPSTPAPAQAASYRFTGPNLPAMARLARRWVVDLLLQSGWGGLVERAELCTSELVTNAHRHTASPVITVEVLLGAGRVTVRVHDSAPGGAPRPRPAWADPYALTGGGRGLGLVDALADEWSVAGGEDSKAVWFALAAPPSGEPPEAAP